MICVIVYLGVCVPACCLAHIYMHIHVYTHSQSVVFSFIDSLDAGLCNDACLVYARTMHKHRHTPHTAFACECDEVTCKYIDLYQDCLRGRSLAS